MVFIQHMKVEKGLGKQSIRRFQTEVPRKQRAWCLRKRRKDMFSSWQAE
jgi:hypothetical protein